MTASPKSTCVVCNSSQVRPFLHIEKVPIFCNVQWSSRDDAQSAPLGEIDLAYCRDCGHIFNAGFDPERIDYTQSYENSLHFSPHFHSHAEALASRLIDKYDIRSKTVVEIGCGKGEFISMLCEAGGNRGYGFDRSYEDDRESRISSGSVTFINDFYDERHSDLNADLLCCRHVLEHIQFPTAFMAKLHKVASDSNALLYFEVPNVLYSIDDMGIWDFIYEHCSYFCRQSLERCFRMSGYEVLDAYTDFGNQFLCIEAKPSAGGAPEVNDQDGLSELSETIADFEEHYRDKVRHWKAELSSAASDGRSVFLWGSGSKGVTFLNSVEGTDVIQAIVDVNPNKQGKFVAGTGHEIVSPESLRESSPDLVIVMNPLYQDEIKAMLNDLGLQPDVLCA